MPDRLVRDELLTSERYWSVSPEARNLYISVLLSADDTGRFTASRFALRTKCMAGTVSAERIEKLLLELVDVDLLRLYDEGRHLFIPRYRQRLRYPHSRYPEPPKGINDISSEKTDLGQAQDRLKTAEVKRSEVKRSEVNLNSTAKASHRSSALDLPDWIPLEPWNAWIEARKKTRKPPTDYALRLAVRKLENLRDRGEEPTQVLMQSAFNGWADLYPQKESK